MKSVAIVCNCSAHDLTSRYALDMVMAGAACDIPIVLVLEKQSLSWVTVDEFGTDTSLINYVYPQILSLPIYGVPKIYLCSLVPSNRTFIDKTVDLISFISPTEKSKLIEQQDFVIHFPSQPIVKLLIET